MARKQAQPEEGVRLTHPSTGTVVTVEKDKADAYKARRYSAAGTSSTSSK